MRAALLAAGLLALASCGRGAYPVDVFPEMHYSPAQRRLEPDRPAVADGAVPTTGRAALLSFEAAGRQTNPLPRQPATLERAHLLYAQNCAMCHALDGHGRTPTAAQFAAAGRAPPVDLAEARVQARSDGQIEWIVANGLGGMPPFRNLLSEPERWALVYAVRELQGR